MAVFLHFFPMKSNYEEQQTRRTELGKCPIIVQIFFAFQSEQTSKIT